MKIGKYNVPESWGKMSQNERVNYLTNSYQVNSYAQAIAIAKKLEAPAKTVPTEKKKEFWWNKGNMA